MVVAEGVARSLDPDINIWDVAKPVVERYIRENIGPKALLRDLGRTAIVLARFGPKLPQMAQAALIRQSDERAVEPRGSPWKSAAYMVLGAALVGAGYWAARLF
jgi:ubiquinone biosynthesis protein